MADSVTQVLQNLSEKLHDELPQRLLDVQKALHEIECKRPKPKKLIDCLICCINCLVLQVL